MTCALDRKNNGTMHGSIHGCNTVIVIIIIMMMMIHYNRNGHPALDSRSKKDGGHG